MYKLEDIRQVHLEITELCQAACPMCMRTINNGVTINPHLNMSELTLEDCKQIFTTDFLKQVNNIYLCGNFGDPIIAKDTLAIMQYFRENNKELYLDIHTNGGARNTEWWTALAKILGNKGRVIFGVDGLKDTNHIHRQNVNWDIVENSMRSFVSAGGIADWHFLVFGYNEHQIEDAKILSKEIGIANFVLKKTSRFINSPSGIKGDVVLKDNKGNIKNIISKPSVQYQNSESSTIKNIIETLGSMDKFHDIAEIQCKALPNRLYISAEGLALPCCWTAGDMYKGWIKDYKSEEIWKIIDSIGGKEKLDAKQGLENVFSSGIFDKIKDSWSKPSCAEGKLKVCSKNCASTFNPHAAQYV